MLVGVAFLALSRLASLALPAAARVFVDDVVSGAKTGRMSDVYLWVASGVAIQAICAFVLFRLLTVPTIELVSELRIRAISHLLRLRINYFDSKRTGALLPRVLNDVDSLRILFGQGFVEFMGSLLFSGFAAAYMWTLSPRLTLVAIATFLAFTALLAWAFWGLAPVYGERARLLAETTGRLTEAISGIRVIKLFRAEDRESRSLSEAVLKMRDNGVAMASHNRAFAVASTLIVGTLGLGLMTMALAEMRESRLTLGGLTTFVLLIGLLAGPVYMLMALAAQFADALVSIERLQEVLDSPPEGGQPPEGATRPAEGGDQTREGAPLTRGAAIRIEGVNFFYVPGAPVLHDVSLEAPAGTSLALVGPSGAGKSTIVSLLTRFYEPESGTIHVDDVEIRTIPLDRYRALLGVVPQDTFLFDATVRDNVRVARPEATDSEVEGACHAAHVDQFVSGFEKGYETVVGERGVRLSGGQKQRLAIARAVLADPRILLLDEATSSLDAESEALIQKSLTGLMRSRTTIVVAHRLSTIRRCDRICVVEAGRVTAWGTHDELLTVSKWYRESVTRQSGPESAEVFL
jgi:subfamily B ATP-binding cassette protein MsbA